MARLTLRRLAIAMPFVFLLHMAEDSVRLVAWFNARVESDVSSRLFVVANVASFVIATVVVILLVVFVHRAWVPGLANALLLYLPFSIALIRAAAAETRMWKVAAASIALAGGIPMYVHGWLVVFEVKRLFRGGQAGGARRAMQSQLVPNRRRHEVGRQDDDNAWSQAQPGTRTMIARVTHQVKFPVSTGGVGDRRNAGFACAAAK